MTGDMTGQRFGRLAVIRRNGSRKKGRGCLALWLCACDCGVELTVDGSSLRSGNTSSCGCVRREKLAAAAKLRNRSRALDLKGQRFGRLTADRRLPAGEWLCLCDCGSAHRVLTYLLRSGAVKSCGCLRKEMSAARSRERTVESPSYGGAHHRVRRRRGVASDQQCVDCGSAADEWSYDHTDEHEFINELGHAYSGNPQCYLPRCRSCHRLFDNSKRWATV